MIGNGMLAAPLTAQSDHNTFMHSPAVGYPGADEPPFRVTVVTPCFNMREYLPRTIESTLAELEPGDEYFVIDGGSTDGSVDVIKSYAHRLSGWVSERDRGYADALAKGFARATGDVLCWINASDLLLPGSLRLARRVLSGGTDLIFGDDFYIDEQDRVIFFSRGYVRDLRAAMLYGGWAPLQDACFWRRSLYERAGGIDIGLPHAADYDLFLRMSGLGRTEYVPFAFSAFRRHQGQKSISGSSAYEQERRMARTRELAREPKSALGKIVARSWHALALRWRIRVMQRTWRRTDLHGRSVTTIPAGPYWPRESGSFE
jgi:glycosyltransferase involved in cell wall biosynthesis